MSCIKRKCFTPLIESYNQYDAEDAVQEAFIAIARHLDAVENPADYRTAAYVTITVKNMALKILQKKTSSPVFYENEENEIPDDTDFVEHICEQEEVKNILSEIYKLADTYRDVLILYFVNGLKVKEITDLLGRNRNTVKSQIKRGKSILLSALCKKGYVYEKQ